MKAVKNNDGTVDIKNMTEREALLLLAITGEVVTRGEEGVPFDALQQIFPNYINGWRMYGNFLNRSVALNRENFRKIADYIFRDTPRMAGLASKPISAQRRDPYGRFAKKVWVARFLYPDSQNRWKNVARTVITNESLESLDPVFYFYGDSIEGIDLARGSFRKFTMKKIVGRVKWTREYASDVR